MWTDVVAWLQTPAGLRVLDSAILPFVAIVLAGVLAALIARSAVRGLIRRSEQDSATAVVATVLEAARRAAAWPALQTSEQRAAEQLASEADLRLRLMPQKGAVLAADWAGLRTDQLKRRAVNFTHAPKDELDEVRDGLAAWLKKPSRAKRLFAADVAAHAAEATTTEQQAPLESSGVVAAADTSAPHRHVASGAGPQRSAEPAPKAGPSAPDNAGATSSSTQSAPIGPSHAVGVGDPTPQRQNLEGQSPPPYSSPDPEDDVDIDPEDRVPMPPPVSAISVRDRIRTEEPPAPRP